MALPVNRSTGDPITAADINAIAAAVNGVAGETTEVMFSSLSGADDDAKLAGFMSTQRSLATGQIRGKTLVLDEPRVYTFNNQQVLYNGFSIRGAMRPQDQPRSSLPVGNRINLRMTGGWFTLPTGSTFGCSFQSLSIDGTISNRLVEGHATAVLWTSVFRDISVQNCAGVLGSKATQLLLTASSIDGWWNVNNVQERALHFGGSDNRVMPTEFLLDSPPELLAANEYLMGVQSFSKTHFQNFYITAEGHSAISVAGTGDIVSFREFAIEGRNAGAPCLGALVRVTGNTQVTIRDSWLAYAMTNPSATGRNDAGVVHATTGKVLMDGCVYERATGVAETVPLFYASGGAHRIFNIRTVGFTGKPVVRQAAPGLITCDDTVTLVTDTTASAPAGTANVGSGFANTGTTLTVAKPTGAVSGDLLVAAVWNRNATAVYTTPPTGWTEIAPVTDNTTLGVMRFYTHVAGASEPTSYTWSGGGSGRQVGTMCRVVDSNDNSPLNVAGTVATLIGSPDRVIQNSVTTTTANTLLLAVAGANTTGGLQPAFTSTEMTALVSSSTNTAASESGITLFAQQIPAAGATGVRSQPSTQVAGSGLGYMIAINSG